MNAPSRRGARAAALPPALVLGSIVCVQTGAGLADRLFSEAPAAAVTGLRLWSAAVIIMAISVRPAIRAAAGIVRRRARRDAAVVIAFGVAMGAMNFSIYQAFSRIPLGVAVTIEFLGPLAVAVAGSRRLIDGAWIVLAAGGVLLLTGHPARHLDVTGVAFAGVAAVGWACYIVLSSATGRRLPGQSGLVIAIAVAALAVTPAAGAAADGALAAPAVVGTGAAVGLLSSVIPYGLELEALRRVPPRVFGIWMSVEPAVAALIGLVMLGQALSVVEWAAVGCVVAASVGAAAGSRAPAPRDSP